MFKLRKNQAADEELDLQTAGQMLNNVLDQCNYEHASVPIEVLSSYSKYRRERYALQNALIIGMLVLFLLLPFLFLSPSLRMTSVQRGQVLLEVKAVLPVVSVSARMDGKNVAIYDGGNGEYTLKPTRNGQLTVTVTLLNRQMTTATFTVSDVDNDAPVCTGSQVSGNDLILSFADQGSGLDPDAVYATVGQDENEYPVTCDPATGRVTMSYPTEIINLYVSDQAGNTLHVMLTPQ